MTLSYQLLLLIHVYWLYCYVSCFACVFPVDFHFLITYQFWLCFVFGYFLLLLFPQIIPLLKWSLKPFSSSYEFPSIFIARRWLVYLWLNTEWKLFHLSSLRIECREARDRLRGSDKHSDRVWYLQTLSWRICVFCPEDIPHSPTLLGCLNHLGVCCWAHRSLALRSLTTTDIPH